MTSVGQLVQVLATLIVLSALGMAANLRVQSLVNAMASQSALAGGVLFGVGWQSGSRTIAGAGVVVFIIKGLVIPGVLRNSLRRGRIIGRDTEPSLSLPTSVIVCALLAVLGYAAGRPIVATSQLATGDVFPAGLTLALIGTFLMIVRGTAMSQVVGLMVVGNGILLVAAATTPAAAVLPELGIAFEILIMAVVAGMQLFRIERAFDQLERTRLPRPDEGEQ
jgi:hydrogenase-4 component E